MYHSSPTPSRWVLCGLTALLLSGLAGCGPQLPKTYPVKGKVVFKGGKAWKAGGTITFQLVSDPTVMADGQIQPDGTFTLTTKMHGKARAGAAAGEHKVMVEEGSTEGKDGQAVIRPVGVGKTYQVVPGGENNFVIEAVK
ncbi:MAG: hypothetical protein L0Z62_05990 [Gemmataceae bacterium]|nr:hypothetical protein [Gemmataceae bacterium]